MDQRGPTAGGSPIRRYNLAAMLLLPVTLFLIVPAVIAQNNHLDVLSISGWVWLRLLTLAAGCWVMILVIHLALDRTRLHSPTTIQLARPFTELVIFLLCFTTISGFFFPISQNFEIGQFDSAPIHAANALTVAALALTMTILWFRGFARHVFTAVLLVVTGSAVLALLAGGTTTSYTATQIDHPIDVSSELNLFVVSFDGLARTHMDEVLDVGEPFGEALNGFTVFSNAASSSPATTASIAGELYGNRNYKRWHDSELDLVRHNPEQLFTNVLGRSGFDVSTFGNYSIESTGNRLTSSVEVDQTGLMLMQASLARSLTRFAVPQGTIARASEKYLTRIPGLDPGDADLVDQVLDSPTNAQMKVHTNTVIDYREFVNALRVATDRPTAFFVHFTHTHFPVEFDANCDYRADDWNWYRANQDYEGSLAEHHCAADQLRSFLQRVEDLGVAEHSLIVIKGDHGKPTQYAPEGSMQSMQINGHARYGLSRYAPFLMIKPLEADRTRPAVRNDQPVMLDDLARTLCEELDVDHDCGSYPGFNILRDQVDPESEVTAFVVKSPSSSHKFDDHEAVTFSRGESVVRSLHDALAEASR